MQENAYGWVQISGKGFVAVGSENQPAFVDFRPNEARLQIDDVWPSDTPQRETQNDDPPAENINIISEVKQARLSQLPALLIESGPYCNLLREARDVFVDGYFYACVAMCGISFERFQRDKAKPHGGTDKDKVWQIRKILKDKNLVSTNSLALCKDMADMRNKYAHGVGVNSESDAVKALSWMHAFIDNETNLMKDFVVTNGVLKRKHSV